MLTKEATLTAAEMARIDGLPQNGIFSSLSSFFTKITDDAKNKRNRGPLRITAMCAAMNTLVLGFSNGVLINLDTKKIEITYSNKVRSDIFVNLIEEHE
jgi:hypothetical protein